MRKLLILLAVLLLLVVGADIGGRAYAESKASDAIGAKSGTTAPSVVIHGFSFLAQALPGHYQNITLASSDVTAGPITGIDATIELYDVDFPLSDAVKGDTSSLTAAQATLRGVIGDSVITAAMGQKGVTLSAGSGGAIRASATISVGGQQVAVTADLVASYASGVLHLKANGLDAAGVTLPDVAQLTDGLSLSLPLKGLPFIVQAATLTASGSSLILTATANNVTVGSVS